MAFSIEINNWLTREYGTAIERHTLAELVIRAGDQIATELEDLPGKTVRAGIRVSAYALAQWFMANWWRLRWEPERNSHSWRMSHKIGAVGEGYLWPDLSFISDGGTVLVLAKSNPRNPNQQVRYLNDLMLPVLSDEYEQAIDTFVETVIARLIDVGVAEGDELNALWREILEERSTPDLAAWRRMEAILGFDPGEAPDEIIVSLQRAAHQYGASAVEEVVAESMEDAMACLDALWDGPCQRAPQLQVPNFDELREKIAGLPGFLLPWQKATEVARIARGLWGLGHGPISTNVLSEVFGVGEAVISERTEVDGPMNAGFRDGRPDVFGVFLKSPIPVSRRFALLRLVGDHLVAPREDRLLPAAPTVRTQRQKFQRAFAQEFLCPYSELRQRMGENTPNDEDIESIALEFEVSSRMIQTILVNKGAADNERFEELRR